jgi:hypothetical protein
MTSAGIPPPLEGKGILQNIDHWWEKGKGGEENMRRTGGGKGREEGEENIGGEGEGKGKVR